MTMPTLDTMLLVIGGMGFIILLLVWHISKDVKFDLRSAILNDVGEFSLSRTGQLVALLTSTWVIIHQTRTGALTEWLMTAYLLTFAGANGFAKYMEKK